MSFQRFFFFKYKTLGDPAMKVLVQIIPVLGGKTVSHLHSYVISLSRVSLAKTMASFTWSLRHIDSE